MPTQESILHDYPPMTCRICRDFIDEEQAAKDWDIGLASWDLCDLCANDLPVQGFDQDDQPKKV